MRTPDYYKINFKRLTELLNPFNLRSHFTLVLLWCCIRPVAKCHANVLKPAIDEFYSTRSYNATVVSLLTLLHKRFCKEEYKDVFGEDAPFKIEDIESLYPKATLVKQGESIASAIVLRNEEETGGATVLYTQEEQSRHSYFLLKFPESMAVREDNETQEEALKRFSDEIGQTILHYIPCGIKYDIENY